MTGEREGRSSSSSFFGGRSGREQAQAMGLGDRSRLWSWTGQGRDGRLEMSLNRKV